MFDERIEAKPPAFVLDPKVLKNHPIDNPWKIKWIKLRYFRSDGIAKACICSECAPKASLFDWPLQVPRVLNTYYQVILTERFFAWIIPEHRGMPQYRAWVGQCGRCGAGYWMHGPILPEHHLML